MSQDDAFDTTAQDDDPQRVHLIAAAEAARSWALARRAIWADRSLPRTAPPRQLPTPAPQPQLSTPAPQPQLSRWLQPEAEPIRVEPPPALTPAAPAWEPSAQVREPVEPLSPPERKLKAVDRDLEPLKRWVRRGAFAAVLLGAAGTAVWMTRGVWPGWISSAGEIASPARPATAAASSARAGGQTARLEVRSNTEGATVLVDGVERGVAPQTIDDLPPGQHVVMLKSKEGSVYRNVDLTAGSAVIVDEAIFPGWIRVASTIDLEVTEGPRAVSLNDEGSALLPPGPHTLRFENKQLGYTVTRDVTIMPGETTPVSIVPAKSTLTVAATLPSEVFIDGSLAGPTPLSGKPIELGTRDVLVKSQSGVERRFTITVGAKPSRIDVDFSKP